MEGLRQFIQNISVMDLVDALLIALCLSIAYGALWCVFGGGPW